MQGATYSLPPLPYAYNVSISTWFASAVLQPTVPSHFFLID